ncbi:MAG: MlaE family lipid ABC transporter permease subunit [Myxococcales bacterium]|nr:MlaE family lipid ABC transporter permease subunit [Myxococcales bacterium]
MQQFAHSLPASPGPLRWPGQLGRATLRFVGSTGRRALFLRDAVAALLRPPLRVRLMVEQLYLIGNRSVWLIVLTSVFTGMVLTLQGYNVLVRFGSEELVGSLVALSLIRELGPVLAALMLTARAGSAIAATLGNMRLTEQIDAMRAMAVDPIQYLVTPRLVASVVAGPLLTTVFILSGIGAGYLFGVSVLGLEGSTFIANVRRSVEWSDVQSGLIKALVFAVSMAWVSTFRGFFARGGAEGVGLATMAAVVEIAVLILVGDYVMTALMF